MRSPSNVWHRQLLGASPTCGNAVTHQMMIHAQGYLERTSDTRCLYRCASIGLVSLQHFDSQARADVLATLRHQREAAFSLLRPVSAYIGVCKVPVTDGLDMLDIYELTELP
jgi:hypothetical protein